jgi:hypothetical protein
MPNEISIIIRARNVNLNCNLIFSARRSWLYNSLEDLCILRHH